MKNNNFVKTILALAAILIVFSLSVSAFAETGKNTSGEISEVTANEASAELDEKTSETAAETNDAETAVEENTSDSGAEKSAKHHKRQKPAASESGTETESRSAEDLGGDQNNRSGKKNKAWSSAEEDQEESFKKHSFGKSFDDDDDEDDDDDDDDDKKEYSSKRSFGRSKRNQSRQQSERPEDSADQMPKHGCSQKHGPSTTKKCVPPASEEMNDEAEGSTDAQNEIETGETGSAEAVIEKDQTVPETVTEEIPESETPEAEPVKDEA